MQLLEELQKKDKLLGPILQGKTPAQQPYIVQDGLVLANINKHTESTDEQTDSQLLVALPEALRDPVLYAGHEAAGHFGASKTKALISQHFYWPRMGRNMPVWNSHKEPKPPLQPLSVVSTPWSKVALDIVGPLPLTKDSNRYLLTMVDFGTRFVEAILLKGVQPAKRCCKCLPTLASQKQYSQTTAATSAAVMEELLKNLSCPHITSAPYHPQSNGMVERVNGIVKKVIDKIAAGRSYYHQCSWPSEPPSTLPWM